MCTSLRVKLLTFALCLIPASGYAQSFQPGWYVAEPSAEFFVLQRSADDPDDEPLWIAAGEVVMCYDKSGDTFFCYEQHGRMSAIRGAGGLTPAKTGGKPGYVQAEVQLMDRVLMEGMTLWVVNLNAGTGQATVQLEGGRIENVPAASVAILANYYRNALAGQEFTRVMN